jgi:pimeloyl-ACP methyl ester carboxylesterase
VDRIDIFRKLAEDVEKQKKAGAGSGGGRATELLALAISGWAMGPNGAVNTVEAALRQWQLRESLLAYQNEDILSNRRGLFNRILKGAPQVKDVTANAELLSQMIKYLPPPLPEDLANPSGQAIPSGDKVVPGIRRKNTGPIEQTVSGVDYLLRLPSEYHHGRSYPVVLALTHNTIPAEQLITLLSLEADRRGYILAAPLWAGEFDAVYDWKGQQHYKVSATLRNLMRRYNVDNNRVFLFGFGEGANFALDMGASHPDLFAGVSAMAPNPMWQGGMMHYWRNCQKLPVLITMGALAGSAMTNVKHICENWMMKGYPALAAIYRGRAMEWFGGDLHLIFDWMKNKKRATGVATLRLNNFSTEPWIIMRPQDNRFYWVGTDSIRPAHLTRPGSFVPAEIKADIAQGNEIRISTLGLNEVTIWFDREMIDWSKPVSVRINGDIPRGYKPKILQPDLEVMLEQFYQHGDRSMLFLNKMSFVP